MTKVNAYNEGYVSGVRGEDPRLCPYQKMTAEWRAWNEGQRWGAAIHHATKAAEQETP